MERDKLPFVGRFFKPKQTQNKPQHRSGGYLAMEMGKNEKWEKAPHKRYRDWTKQTFKNWGEIQEESAQYLRKIVWPHGIIFDKPEAEKLVGFSLKALLIKRQPPDELNLLKVRNDQERSTFLANSASYPAHLSRALIQANVTAYAIIELVDSGVTDVLDHHVENVIYQKDILEYNLIRTGR